MPELPFAVFAENEIWHDSETAIGNWSGWTSLGDADANWRGTLTALTAARVLRL